MDNQEGLLLEIDEFNRSSDIEPTVSQNLENFIEHVAKTGVYVFPWNKIKKLYLKKLTQVIDNFNQISGMDTYPIIPNSEKSTFLEIKSRIIERMQSFNTNAPFTIQRISELLIKPQSNYNRTDKFLRGLEKCVMVVTTVDSNGCKIFTELTNGLNNEATPPTTPTPFSLPPPLSQSPLPIITTIVNGLPTKEEATTLEEEEQQVEEEKNEEKIEDDEVENKSEAEIVEKTD